MIKITHIASSSPTMIPSSSSNTPQKLKIPIDGKKDKMGFHSSLFYLSQLEFFHYEYFGKMFIG